MKKIFAKIEEKIADDEKKMKIFGIFFSVFEILKKKFFAKIKKNLQLKNFEFF